MPIHFDPFREIDRLTEQALQYEPEVRLGEVIESISHRSDDVIELHTEAGLTLDDIGLFELNEPFAVQVLSWCDGLGVEPEDERLNPYGGAIACGHPLAATGVRLLAQLAYGFRERPHARYGLAALCVGMGMGAALIWENVAA